MKKAIAALLVLLVCAVFTNKGSAKAEHYARR